jgi:hypothetical protein
MDLRDVTQMERAALAYAARGWSVIPAESRAKRPIIAWQEFQQRIARTDEIMAWFRHWPRANIAIVTGAVSRLVVLDIDPRHGGCVIAPPSVHPSGKRYTWVPSHGPDDAPSAPMPRWLDEWVRADSRHPGQPVSHWRELARRGVRQATGRVSL